MAEISSAVWGKKVVQPLRAGGSRPGWKNIGILMILMAIVIMTGNGNAFFPFGNSEQASISDSKIQVAVKAGELIRFHVLANSDSSQDQELKHEVRDAILERVSPRLARSQSLEESRRLLQEVMPEMKTIAEQVVQAEGKKDAIQVVYGTYSFPTKSYGSLVLPAGEYEAVRVLIGQAAGSNWWCVLFPPLCFVNAEEATTVPVDGKPTVTKRTQPRSWIWEQVQKLWNHNPG